MIFVFSLSLSHCDFRFIPLILYISYFFCNFFFDELFYHHRKCFAFNCIRDLTFVQSADNCFTIKDCIFVADMGETGKRFRPQRDIENDDRYHKRRANKDNSDDDKYQKRRGNDKDNTNDDKYQKRRVNNNKDEGELIVYRILCPDGVIGSVIGKNGKVINSLRQGTWARIKVVDPFPGANERVITIFCHVKDKDDKEVDEDDAKPLCASQDALLKVHSIIRTAVTYFFDSDKEHKEEARARILVPTSQVANVIGKSGSTVKRLRAKTRTNIKITPKDPNDPTQSFAMSFDNIVEVYFFSIRLMFCELNWRPKFKSYEPI